MLDGLRTLRKLEENVRELGEGSALRGTLRVAVEWGEEKAIQFRAPFWSVRFDNNAARSKEDPAYYHLSYGRPHQCRD